METLHPDHLMGIFQLSSGESNREIGKWGNTAKCSPMVGETNSINRPESNPYQSRSIQLLTEENTRPDSTPVE